MNKISFLLRRPKVIVVAGEGRQAAKETILRVLRDNFKIGENVLIFESGDGESKNLEFFLKYSRKAVLLITHTGDIPADRDFFSGDREKIKEAISLIKTLPNKVNLILNYDDETVREIKDFTGLKTFTFGLSKNADFSASDVKSPEGEPLPGTNFKLNYKGNIVPFWMENTLGKEQIYAVLAAVAVGTIFNLNLVEISQTLVKEIKTP